jgi:hypothetical protein
MDKNIIKNQLTARFLNEESTPGIDVTKKAQKQSEKINKDAVKDIDKGLADYEKSIEKNTGKATKMPTNKFNYNGDKEKEYHDQMEIMNGQEMIQYDRDPNQEFKDRAEEAIAGSSRMGNNPEWANVVVAGQGGDPTFGKNLVKAIKASTKKRTDADYRIISFGTDIENVPKNSKKMAQFSALSEGKEQASKDIENKDNPDDMSQSDASGDDYEKIEREYQKENKNNNKPQIKQGMKRLNFKKEFNGVGNALKMIPESYKVDNKVFEMADGNESYKIRWEGTLSEGRAVVLTASNKSMVNEDMQKMKHLMGYKSEKTLGLVKGNARLNENAIFNDIYVKTKALLEGEDIEDQDASEGDLNKAVSIAKEAKKDIQGSVSNDKGTQAPKPKTGESVKSQAPEAKKDVEGSVESKTGLGLGVKAKEGNWDDISVPQAAEAKKHITMSETVKKKNKVGIQLGENYFEEMEMPEEMPSEEPKYEEKITLNDILGKLNLAVTTEDDNESEALIKSAFKDLGEKIKTMGQKGLKKGADFLRNQFDEPMGEGMYGEGVYEGEYDDENSMSTQTALDANSLKQKGFEIANSPEMDKVTDDILNKMSSSDIEQLKNNLMQLTEGLMNESDFADFSNIVNDLQSNLNENGETNELKVMVGNLLSRFGRINIATLGGLPFIVGFASEKLGITPDFVMSRGEGTMAILASLIGGMILWRLGDKLRGKESKI